MRIGTSGGNGPISIHAPRVGSDMQNRGILQTLKMISIHAPRVGSDILKYLYECLKADFNPRSPCGERRA